MIVRLLDAVFLGAIALSYPLYVVLDALPRAREVGPPVVDRYPWLLVAGLVALLGTRCKTLLECLICAEVLTLAGVAAHTDEAEISGIAVQPFAVFAIAFHVLLAGHVIRRLLAAMMRNRTEPQQGA